MAWKTNRLNLLQRRARVGCVPGVSAPAIDRSNFSYLGLLGECSLVWVSSGTRCGTPRVCDAIRNAVTIGHWQLLSVSHFRTI